MKPLLRISLFIALSLSLTSSSVKKLEFERVFTLSFNELTTELWTDYYKPETLKTWRIENIWIYQTKFSETDGIDIEINGAMVSHSFVLKNDFPFWLGSQDSIRFRASGSNQMSASITEFKIVH